MVSGDPREFHGAPEDLIGVRGSQRASEGIRGVPWGLVGISGGSWRSQVRSRSSWDLWRASYY